MSKQKITNKNAAPAKSNFFVFKKENYILLIASAVILVIGFLIMASGKDLPFDAARKITLAPIVVLLGFGVGVVSILYTPKDKEGEQQKRD